MEKSYGDTKVLLPGVSPPPPRVECGPYFKVIAPTDVVYPAVVVLLEVMNSPNTPRFLRQKFAKMPTSIQQVERHYFRFPGPFFAEQLSVASCLP